MKYKHLLNIIENLIIISFLRNNSAHLEKEKSSQIITGPMNILAEAFRASAGEDPTQTARNLPNTLSTACRIFRCSSTVRTHNTKAMRGTSWDERQ